MQVIGSRRKAPPSIDHPYTSAAKVFSLNEVLRNQLVVTTSVHGNYPAVELADATDPRLSRGRLSIAKNNCPENQYVITLPWRAISGVDTSTRNVGDAIYLGTEGNIVYSPPKRAVFNRQIGTVLSCDVHGTIMLDVTSESDHKNSMSAAHVQPAQASTKGTLPIMFRFDVDLTGKATAIPVDFPLNIVDVWAVKTEKTSKSGTITVQTTRGDMFSPISFTGVDVGDIVRVTKLPTDGRRSVAGGALSVITSGKNTACQIYILAERER
jgi:hypothetical protein